jgi:5-formyltetrahydrofolate cyclo-ligase
VDLAGQKRNLRTRMLSLLAEHADREGDSKAIAERFLTCPAMAGAKTIAIFKSLPGEMDTDPIARRIASEGGRLAYPRVVQPGGWPLEFAEPLGFQRGALGILEPTGPTIPLDAIDCFVVPGLAFDRSGSRLGRGRGYYDATLRVAPKARRVGLAFGFQVVDRVPVGPGDEKLDFLVLPDEVVTMERLAG